MEEVESVKDFYTAFCNGELSRIEFKNKLLEYTFLHKNYLGLWSLNDDEFSEFLIMLDGIFYNISEKYNPKLSEFTTFFITTISKSLHWWQPKMHKKNEKSKCCDALLIEENLTESYEQDFLVENKLSIKDLYKITRKKLCYSESSNHVTSKIIKNDSDLFMKEACLILLLKSCNHVTEELIVKVSAITGYSCSKILEFLFKARAATEKKRQRCEAIIKSRNNAYYQRKKISLEEVKDDLNNDKYCIQDKKWHDAVEKLSKQSIVPSDIAIGNILSIAPRHVSKIVLKAKKILESNELDNDELK